MLRLILKQPFVRNSVQSFTFPKLAGGFLYPCESPRGHYTAKVTIMNGSDLYLTNIKPLRWGGFESWFSDYKLLRVILVGCGFSESSRESTCVKGLGIDDRLQRRSPSESSEV